MKKAAVAFIFLMMLASACSKQADSDPDVISANDPASIQAATSTSTSNPNTNPTKSPSPSPGSTTKGSTNKANPAPSPTGRQKLYSPDPNFPINISYALGKAKPKVWAWDYRLCVKRAQIITVTIETVPKGFLTIVATYADNNPRESYALAEASPKGRYDWKWVVPPDAPIGNGLFLVSVKDEQRTGESRPDDRLFEVQTSC